MADRPTITTFVGIPVGDNRNSLTAGRRGPLLVQDWQLFEKHAHFNRERIPERVVHAKGSAAFGDAIAGAMHGVPAEIQKRQIAHFSKCDPAYGAGVAERIEKKK